MTIINTVIKYAMAAVFSVVIVASMLAWPTYIIWNWLCPELFGLPEIGFFQALGLIVLGNVLFKGTCNHTCKK